MDCLGIAAYTVHSISTQTSHEETKCTKLKSAGIPRFVLLMWGHIKRRGKQNLCRSRLLSGTKEEENRREL